MQRHCSPCFHLSHFHHKTTCKVVETILVLQGSLVLTAQQLRLLSLLFAWVSSLFMLAIAYKLEQNRTRIISSPRIARANGLLEIVKACNIEQSFLQNPRCSKSLSRSAEQIPPLLPPTSSQSVIAWSGTRLSVELPDAAEPPTPNTLSYRWRATSDCKVDTLKIESYQKWLTRLTYLADLGRSCFESLLQPDKTPDKSIRTRCQRRHPHLKQQKTNIRSLSFVKASKIYVLFDMQTSLVNCQKLQIPLLLGSLSADKAEVAKGYSAR